MRIQALAALAVLAAALCGCANSNGAAAPVGAAAGNVIGGTAWLGMKGAGLAWKGGKLAAKTTGRVVVGAARGVNEEFSKPPPPPAATASATRTGQVSQASQAQGAALAY
jgi:hypothetical protein